MSCFASHRAAVAVAGQSLTKRRFVLDFCSIDIPLQKMFLLEIILHNM